jgi:hypothetical protein
MNDERDEKVIELSSQKSSLLDQIGRQREPSSGFATAVGPTPELALPAAADDLAPLPRPGDDYKAHARAANKPVPTLRLLLCNGSIRGFPMGHLDSIDLEIDGPGQSPVIVLRFAGLEPSEVRLEGRRLDALYDLLGYERIAWVRELPRDKATNERTVVSGISIRTIERSL